MEHTATGMIITTFTTHLKVKSLTVVIILFIETLIQWNELLIMLMFILYSLDLVIWVFRALVFREFHLDKFFRWASKIIIYWVFLIIWISIDESLPVWQVFTSAIFAFILITDSLSILKNLNKLGYKTPIFIEKYLLHYKKKLDDKFKDYKWD